MAAIAALAAHQIDPRLELFDRHSLAQHRLLYEALGLPSRSDPSPRFLERTAAEWVSWARERDLPIFAVKESGR